MGVRKTDRDIRKEEWALDLSEKIYRAGVSVSPSRVGYTIMVGCTSRDEVKAIVDLLREHRRKSGWEV